MTLLNSYLDIIILYLYMVFTYISIPPTCNVECMNYLYKKSTAALKQNNGIRFNAPKHTSINRIMISLLLVIVHR